MTTFFYEDESFVYNRVPIRVFNHDFYKEIYSTALHWHKNLEIDLIQKGEIVYRIDGNEVHCVPGDILIINSGIPHANYLITREERFEGITVQLAIGFVQEWLGEDIWFEMPEKEDDRNRLKTILLKMGEIRRSETEDQDLRMMEEVFELLSFLKLNCISKNLSEKKERDDLVRIKKVIRYIEDNYQKSLSLKDTAEYLGYTSEHLSRMFKKQVGMNFSRYLQEIRLNHAMTLLRESESISLTDCALESGFPNSRSFISAFRNRFGMLPSVWRKENINN